MSEVRELRSHVRHWRRGRADTRLVEVIEDVYVAVFSALVLGLMVGNVVVQSRRELGGACTADGCTQARTLLPWLVGLGTVLVVLALARVFGPVFVTPAVASWLLSAPVDRGAVLRPRLLVGLLAAVALAAALALPGVTLGGFAAPALLAAVAGAGALAALVVGLAAVSQSGSGLGARLLTWALAAGVWAGLLVLAVGEAPATGPPTTLPAAGLAGTAALVVLAAAVAALAVRRLGAMRRGQVTPGGALAPGLSGALAGLDLAMVYDVLLAHRWRGHEAVRSRRGGPAGVWALVWLDLVRIRRTPQTLVALAAAVVVPYAAAGVDVGRLVILVGALAGFLAGLPLLSALRVVTRTPSILRSLPFTLAATRLATTVVAVGALAAYGLASAPALHAALGEPWPVVVGVGLAVGGSSAAAAVRWVTGRPPDYSRPLVSTPAGAVPTNLYGSVLRGFDILLVTSAPLLLLPDETGAAISLGLSAIVVGYLTSRSERRD